MRINQYNKRLKEDKNIMMLLFCNLLIFLGECPQIRPGVLVFKIVDDMLKVYIDGELLV